MGIERYLCVAGIEVANPNRTLAYLAALGSPCLVTPPSLTGCCDCPPFRAPAGDCPYLLTWGWNTPEGDEYQQGMVSGLANGEFMAELTVISERKIDVASGTPGIPPPFSDPGWAYSEGLPDTLPLPILGGGSYADSARYGIVTVDLGGEEHSFWYYVDPPSMSPGDSGNSAISLDGENWTFGGGPLPFEAPCPPGQCAVEIEAGLNYNDPEVMRSGICRFWVDGVNQPEPLVTIRTWTFDGPCVRPAEPPPADDPGWVIQSENEPLTLPAITEAPYGVGGCGLTEISFLGDCEATIYVFSDLPSASPGDGGNNAVWDPVLEAWSTGGMTVLSFAGSAPAPSGAFTSPAADDAPWYDPAVPESADVLGVWIEEARLGVPWTREARQRIRGASLGPGRLGGRELQLSGWLYARTEAASAYGRQWLFEALAGSGCDGGCDLPDAEIFTYCDAEGTGARTLKRVGLTAFDPEIEPEFPRACGFKFEATLTAEIPELFLEPDPIVAALRIAEPDEICNVCHPCPEPTEAPCACGALAAPVRVAPVPDPASSYCEPLILRRSCLQLDPPPYWRDATAIIRVRAGSEPLANLRIRAWANPAGLDDSALFECQDPCLSIEVACVPAGAELVIDGTTREASVICGAVALNGYAYLSSGGGQRFEWPDVSCHGLMLCVDADSAHTAADAELDVDLVLRERG